jgi:nucleoside-diphosphate-sugar epimerase
VLVTGASGFIGSVLVRRLVEHGADVHAVSRNPPRTASDGVQWSQADLADLAASRQLFEAAKPTVVFHLASYVAGARDLALVLPTFASNLATTVNILTVAAERGCDRIVLTGSLEEPREPDAAPSSPYAAAKHAASAYGKMFHELFGLPVVMLRVFMVYGPGQGDLRKLVPSVILSLLRGEAPRLTSGRRQIDWIFVDDVVTAMIAAAVAPSAIGRTLDVGSGELVSIRSIVDRLVRLMDSRIEPLFGAVPDRPLEQVRVADVAATRSAIGWQPVVELDEGLRRTIDWYREQVRLRRMT